MGALRLRLATLALLALCVTLPSRAQDGGAPSAKQATAADAVALAAAKKKARGDKKQAQLDRSSLLRKQRGVRLREKGEALAGGNPRPQDGSETTDAKASTTTTRTVSVH